jgi:hypothetical protein
MIPMHILCVCRWEMAMMEKAEENERIRDVEALNQVCVFVCK